jgi:CRP-like cAMP-binding protein
VVGVVIEYRELDILKRNEAFLGLSDEVLSRIAALPSCHIRQYKPEQAIFRAGEHAETIGILASGTVDITVPVATDRGGYRDEIVDTVRKGSILGWSSMVPPHIFTRSAIARSNCEVLTLAWKELEQLMDQEPRIGYEMAMAILRILHTRYMHVQQLLVSGKRHTTC